MLSGEGWWGGGEWKLCDDMFVSHVNAIINICADFLKNYVCNHINLF